MEGSFLNSVVMVIAGLFAGLAVQADTARNPILHIDVKDLCLLCLVLFY